MCDPKAFHKSRPNASYRTLPRRQESVRGRDELAVRREHRRLRALVADDDPSIRQLLCTIVRRERFDVDSVADGAEAIEKLQQHEYDIILLDLMMPRVDGFDVIDYLKENPPTTKPVVLVITAYADQKFKEVDASVVAEVVPKPFEIAELTRSLRVSRFTN